MRLNSSFRHLAVYFTFAVSASLHAQVFNSGSNESYGPILVDSSTGDVVLQVPEDGIFHCTTITIRDGKTLTFLKNASNTPVYLLASGDVEIGTASSSGIITVSGKAAVGSSPGAGGPGGFNGGMPSSSPSSGFGPGGGVAGNYYHTGTDSITMGGASYGTAGAYGDGANRLYGSPLLIPLIGGSGGGSGFNATSPNSSTEFYGGGGGGGAILIASNTQIRFSASSYTGQIQANGGTTSTNFGGGSGGAIRLVAPYLSGRIRLEVNGNSGGGYGRTRIDCGNHDLSINNADSQAIFGNNMIVFPPNMPKIRITKIAGQIIDNAQTGTATYILPPGTPNLQTIEVSVSNFGTNVPLVAVISPEVGDKIRTEFSVNNSAGGTTSGSVQVQIPAGQLCEIEVWTR